MLFNYIADALFPGACVSCHSNLDHGALLCPPCEEGVLRHQTLFCATCLARLPSNESVCHPSAGYRFGAATEYNNPVIRELIHLLKFKSVYHAAEPLGRMLARYVSGLGLDLASYRIIPIPLGRARERSRGFNQAELIARALGDEFHIPVVTDILVRNRSTRPQTELGSATERAANVQGAFAVRNATLLAGGNVIIVDDVRTSGATLHEAVRTLKASGARKILALTVARA